MTASSFQSLGLSEKTLAVLKKKGFEEPTPIQALAIPLLLTGDRDLVARARTGTGKTAAFGLPLVERLCDPSPHVRALVLVPTRELAIQVHAEIASLRHGTHPRTVAVYGGQAISLQMRSLERGVDVVVGTPGRVIDMIQRAKLDLSHVEFLVLDEADEMLDMGFTEEIDTIFEAVNPERRVLMFSATMQDAVMRVARKRLRNFTTIEDHAKTEATELTEQIWLEVREQDKMEAFTGSSIWKRSSTAWSSRAPGSTRTASARPSRSAGTPWRRSTETTRRSTVTGSWRDSARARRASSWQPTLRRAASTWKA